MRQGGGTCVGCARVVDERTRGEDPPPPDTPLQCRPRLYNPRSGRGMQGHTQRGSGGGMGWEWMRCKSVVCGHPALVCRVPYFQERGRKPLKIR